MNGDRVAHRVRAGHFKVVKRFHRTAGYRDFRADDIDRPRGVGACERLLGHGRQTRRPAGGKIVGQGHRFAGAAHAGIEMQLGEAGFGIGLDHRRSLAIASSAGRCFHGLGPRWSPARIRSCVSKPVFCAIVSTKARNAAGVMPV